MMGRLRVAFVDDEPNVLNGLRRSMLVMLDEWEMAFFKSGPDLLARMMIEGFDVVVSDIRMPEMDGAVLLGEVRRRHPDTVRVILSGYADKDVVFQTIGPAHIYLSKPCDPEALRRAIAGRAMLRGLMEGQEMRRLLGGTTSLPSAPDLFIELVEELRSPRSSTAAVAAIIGKDVAMTAELLKLTNSSYFAVNAQAATPLQAVRILGLDLIQTLVLQIGIFQQFQGSPEMRRHIEALNEYGLELGSLAEAYALAAGQSDEVATAARCSALLSTIGCLVLLKERNEAYLDLLAALPSAQGLDAAEAERFGAGHGLLGAYLLSLWGFADAIVEAVAFAADPSRCLSAGNPVLMALHLARSADLAFPLLARPGPAVRRNSVCVAAAGWAEATMVRPPKGETSNG